jgi:hypothetical protein
MPPAFRVAGAHVNRRESPTRLQMTEGGRRDARTDYASRGASTRLASAFPALDNHPAFAGKCRLSIIIVYSLKRAGRKMQNVRCKT